MTRPAMTRPAMTPPAMKHQLTSDDGSTLPLTIFFGFLSLVLILLVASASSLYLERKRLFTLADGAALAGAEAFTLDEVALTPNGPRVTLRDQDVAVAVATYLATSDTAQMQSLTLEQAGTLDGRSATVRLSAYWRPPILSILAPAGMRLEVTSVARSVFG
jgi:hypothetical protein